MKARQHRLGLPYLLVCSLLALAGAPFGNPVGAQTFATRLLSGTIVNAKQEMVSGVRVIVGSSATQQTTITGKDGWFEMRVPAGPLTLRVEGRYIQPIVKELPADVPTENLVFHTVFVVPSVYLQCCHSR